jgi:PAS domain S-box-containing protein
VPLRVLLLEDLPTDAELLVRELKRAGLCIAHEVVQAEAAFRAALREFEPDLILSDFFIPHFDGMWALELSRELAPDVPFIFVSGTIREEYPMRALRNGAADYVLKSNLARLPVAVERALRAREESAARRIADARHRATFDNAPIGIMHTDIDADRILLANPKMIDLLGYTRDELLGMKVESILHPGQFGTDRGKYRERMLSSELNSFSSERRLVRKDGSDIWVNLTVSVVRDAAGKPLSFIQMISPVPAPEVEALPAPERSGEYVR